MRGIRGGEGKRGFSEGNGFKRGLEVRGRFLSHVERVLEEGRE